MFDTFAMESLVDIGFVALVIILCLRTSVRQKDNASQVTGAWRQELEQLQGSLRELIEEAAASSRNLERRLGKRQQELEKLLTSLEEQAANQRTVDEEDLPNETWREAMSRSAGTPRKVKQKFATQAEEIQKVLEQKKINANRQQQKKSALPKNQISELAAEVEIAREAAAMEQATKLTGITDEATINIAKRLLLEGKEIHVVARKLELPVSEVRVIQSLMQVNSPRKNSAEQISTQKSRNTAGFKRGVEHIVELENALEKFDTDDFDPLDDKYSFV